jgi:hypothetical protein
MTTASYLTKRGVEFDVARAVVWTDGNSRPHLAAWVKLFREARATLIERAAGEGGEAARIALAMVKAIAAVTLGGWLRSDKNRSDLMRRDWSDQIIAESWVRALLAVEKAGAAGFPVMGMRRDSAWWLADEAPIAPAGIEISGKLGKWKHSRHAAVNRAIITAHRGGSAEALNSAIKAAHEAREAAGS